MDDQPTRSPEDRSRDLSQPLSALSPTESLKATSDYLRGTLAESLIEPLSGGISADDQSLLKFHGIYQEDDRDLRDERRRQKLEPAYEFLVRLRLPGGICRPSQWLVLDDLARTYANGTLRLTTRQTFQFHGILKKDLKRTIQGIDQALIDSIGACGDVVRGVLCASLPERSRLHAEMYELAKRTSEHLLPKTRAYHEIWLNETRVAGSPAEEEPLLGRTYLPRKFKIAFAAPPSNDVDIYTHDLGFIAIAEGDRLAGFDIVVGGGMGRADNDPSTFPRLADLIGFCRPDEVIALAEAVVSIQRDYGDRVTRKHARMKYTIDDRGVDWFKGELERRLGRTLEAPRPFVFTANTDPFGWTEGEDGRLHLTLFIENGRVKGRMMEGLRAIAAIHQGDFRLTANQNLIVANIPAAERPRIEALLAEYGLYGNDDGPSLLRRNAMACVALPTCSLAMAESERYLPEFITRLDGILAEYGLGEVPIILRMTGCPNGCARPYVAEIGFSGRGPGTYNLYLGGGFHGQRLNRLFLENADEETIVATLTPIFRRFATERGAAEHFGDFLIRVGIVEPVTSGRCFAR
ncbi:assimilatory sulfite reductase (NADPH) hemoprotein subunit [Magnetospirillum molischianum]|uniref:Sulfite reductase [NADPH] hemoprotein beta-component n=1 Tax=Magnetospirillum molischianum DSM 120 TaxID=1150626 RepID=H8FV32_MAGML|nr:assimilatory sulfite reductase (NADPH) hemoprotein subunit [Magnetospirillum molischianum]CCG42220.1 Sulfite reductase (NADPH) hemoprotein beta-component [Magnetospirillum molischianum DSM 120]